MIGIVAHGAYIPRLRLDRKHIFQAMGWFNPATFGAARGEKAVANHDEDALTMTVAAARDCLGDRSPEDIGALVGASTTFPYLERQNATMAAAALDISSPLRAVDVTSTPGAGTSALLAGIDAVKSGEVAQALVTAADCRLGKPGSGYEHVFGDGAAAMLLGTEGVIAEYVASYSISADFPDLVRTEDSAFMRNWEERWIREEGYVRMIPAAISSLLLEADVSLSDVTRVCIACPDARAIKMMAKRLRLAEDQLVEPLLGTVGDTGAAHPLLLLSAALADAKPGDLVLVAGYGSGSDAILFKATDAIAGFQGPKGVAGHLARREAMTSYQKYLVFKEILPVEVGIRGETQAPTALSVHWREQQAIAGLVGSKCTKCGVVMYPPHRMCVECRAVDAGAPHRLSSAKGTVFSYTGDMLAFSPEPPAIYGLVDMEGGGRLNLDFTDCALDDVSVGMGVELSFRRKYHDSQRGLYGYFWKAIPADA